MCGIAGYCSSTLLMGTAMLQSMGHRGPDGFGEYSEQVGSSTVYLGHRRLAVIDLSEKGRQPMNGRKSVISYNGEVYNFKKLKEEYLRDVQIDSETDTEVILGLYEKLGDSFVEKLNGAFAIAIFDKEEKTIKLFRDRLGIKPLYYYYNNEILVFASEIGAIHQAGVLAELDRSELSDFFVFKYSPGTRTLFKGVKRVKPGSALTYSIFEKTIKTKQYWTPPQAYGSSGLSFNSAMTELSEILGDAVESRLMSDVPIANFLSGGIDSSIIAYHLQGREDIQHYCAVKEASHLRAEGTTSDGYHAAKLAKKWGLRLNNLALHSSTLNPAQMGLVMRHNEDLIADGSLIPSYLMTKEASKEATVVLSGMGADEIFLGYGGHLMTLASMSMSRLPGTVERKMNEFMGALQPGIGSFKAYKRYLSKLGKYSGHHLKYIGLNVVGDVDAARSIFSDKESSLEQMVEEYFPKGQDVFESLSVFERENFLQKNLLYMDRMSMANGMEARVPFLDHRLVEFAHSLPREFKLSNRFRTKHILKEAYRKALPDHILNRRKAGFGMPLRVLLSDESKRKSLLNEDFFSSIEGFDIKTIRTAVAHHVDGKMDNSALIYALISFQSWYKMFIEKDKEATIYLAE